MDWSLVIYFALALVLIYLGSQLLKIPMKIAIKIILNSLLGCAILILLNLVGSRFGISIALNPVTVLVVGFLGVPGIALLLILPFLL